LASVIHAELTPTPSIENLAGVLCRRWSARLFADGAAVGLPCDFFVHRVGSGDPSVQAVLEQALREMPSPAAFDPVLEKVLGRVRELAVRYRDVDSALLDHSFFGEVEKMGDGRADPDRLLTVAALGVLLFERRGLL
jgi:hypothetical protein